MEQNKNYFISFVIKSNFLYFGRSLTLLLADGMYYILITNYNRNIYSFDCASMFKTDG